jgi:pimeloyl-ACP methyl ester carboxylesterase
MPLPVLVIAALLLGGCATKPDLNAFYLDYERDFRQRTAYAVHAVARDDYQLHAREFGAENTGPAIVLLHGFPDSLHLYDRVVTPLARTRRVIAFDFLGWGESDKPTGHVYDVASLRRDLEAVIEHFGLRDVVLVAHDASGQPVIDWALDNPERVAGIVLLNTYYGPMDGLRAPEAIDLFSTPGLRRDITIWLANHSDDRWQAGITEQLEKFMVTPEPRNTFLNLFAYQALQIRPAFFGLNAVLRAEVERRASEAPRLRSFARPVRIAFGAADPYLNSGVARQFATLFPNSDLHLLDDAGHYVQLDRPETVAELIRTFP